MSDERESIWREFIRGYGMTHNHWIPVSEGLPPALTSHEGIRKSTSEMVHVYPHPTVDRAVFYDYDLEKWSCSAEIKVTHWMSIPPPPEVE